jgi:flagellar basal-body rod protein FlgC
MSAFSSIDIGRTGMGFAHHWLDTIAHNLANVNTVRPADQEPFRAQLAVAKEVRNGDTGGGVAIGQPEQVQDDPMRHYDPNHPLADAQGNIVMPVVDMTVQMTDMMIANRSYQASARSIQSAREAYEMALRIGQNR